MKNCIINSIIGLSLGGVIGSLYGFVCGNITNGELACTGMELWGSRVFGIVGAITGTIIGATYHENTKFEKINTV